MSSIGSFQSGPLRPLFTRLLPKPRVWPCGTLPSFDASLALGYSIRPHFPLDFKKWTFLNHGAFGLVTHRALAQSSKWRMHAETQPCRFYDRELMPSLVASLQQLATFFSIPALNLVFVQNATTGINAVLRSLPFDTSSNIVAFTTTYGAVKTALHHTKANIELLDISHQSSDEEIHALLRNKLTCKKVPDLVVLDHITSSTARRFPLETLIPLCHAHNVPVLVDGAHAPLMLDLDLHKLGADFYVGNLHKWMCNTKGCAFLYVSNLEKHDTIRPSIVSHGYHIGFQEAFIWDGLRDYAAALTVSDTLDQWKALGVERSRTYMVDLVQQGAKHVSEVWQSGPILHSTGVSMAMIRIPYQSSSGKDRASTDAIQQHFYEQGIEVPVKQMGNEYYVRVSAHVYNTMEDFEHLARATILHTEPC